MMTHEPPDDLARLHRDLNHRWLNPWWAKAEIVLGLLGVAAAFVAGAEIALHRAAHPNADTNPLMWLGPVVIFVLGAYLALAGHRSHLYQSNNRLAAYLAGLIRSHSPGPRP